MLTMLFETGHPWITFKDPCNLRSPQQHTGVVHSSNLCTEITLNTSAEETAVCNLGSLVADQHLTDDGEIDHEKLRETIRIAVRTLDNVIDINFYPTGPARTSNLRHRPVGLGVMGLQYALYRKGLAFSAPEAIEFGDELMEAIAFYAYEASSDLAAERGRYSSYAGSKWDRGLLPQDTLDLLEQERGAARPLSELQRVEVGPRLAPARQHRPPRSRARRARRGSTRRPTRLGAAANEDRNSGHAELQRARDRADGHDLEHHGQLALYRAALQEPVRQVEPLGRVRRPEPASRT
jgi:ribonucleotide reductase alpha subunit